MYSEIFLSRNCVYAPLLNKFLHLVLQIEMMAVNKY